MITLVFVWNCDHQHYEKYQVYYTEAGEPGPYYHIECCGKEFAVRRFG